MVTDSVNLLKIRSDRPNYHTESSKCNMLTNKINNMPVIHTKKNSVWGTTQARTILEKF